MTVQPLDSGFVDYSQKGAIPDIAEDQNNSGRSRDLSPTSSYEMYPRRYKGNRRPTVVNVNFWGNNGYYMNGPAGDPFDRAQADANAIASYTQSWTSQAKNTSLESFSKLLQQYGSTNSPGTLWALASSNINPNDPAVQKMLAVDAQASADQYGRSQPVRGNAPAATQEASWTDNMWEPLEFVSRNAFAALSMPLEAVQGTLRGIGGQLTEETGPDVSGAVAMLGSLVFPPIALWADRVRGDNEFINPWEQTEFGQTLLSAAGGAGLEAFTTKQAGLDIQRAKDELMQDPEIAARAQQEGGTQAINSLAAQVAQEKGYYSEAGWFIDETSVVGEAQINAAFDAWAIPGPDDELVAWTLGRGIFSNVGGPDWAGYGVASGLVDAAAAILMDPTIIGAKFGLPSKAVKGLSTLARGSDGAILIGKEKRAADAAYSVQMRQLQAAQAKAAAADYDNAVETTAAQLRADLGREPTAGEIQAIIGEPPVVDPTDLAIMDVTEQANLVKQSLIADKTTEALAAVKPDLNYVSSQARDIRRSVATSERAQRVLDKDVATAGAIADPTGARELWQDFITYSYLPENGVYRVDNQGYYRFTEDVLGYDRNGPGTGFADPEKAAQFSDLARRQAAWSIERGVDDDYEASISFLNEIDSMGSRSVKRPKEIPADRVERDTARFLTDEQTEANLGALAEQNIMGASLLSAPSKASPAVGRIDGVDSMVYWTARTEPKLLAGTDVVAPAARRSINRTLQEILSRPEMRLADELDEIDSLAGQVASKIDVATDPRRALEDLMTIPNLTWERLLDEVVNIGLDGVFDDILRSLPKTQRADGITGLRFGTWMGDHPSMSAYAISGTARESAVGIRGMDDIEAALANLDVTAATNVPVGYRSLDVPDLEGIRDTARGAATSQMDTLRNYRSDKIVDAVNQQRAIQSQTDELDTLFADPVAALKETIRYQAGMRNTRTGSLTLDEKGVRQFLFGSGPTSYLANRALDTLSDFVSESDRLKALDRGADSDFYKGVLQRSMGELYVLTNGKWAPETYRAIAINAIEGGGRSGLIDILAPRLGVDVTKGSIAKTTKLKDTDGKRYFKTWRAPNPVIARALGQMPTPRKINLQNADEVSEAIMLYGRYAKVDEGDLSRLIGRVLDADGTMEAVGVNRNAIADTFDEISKTLLQKIDDSGTAGTLFKGRKGEERLSQIKNAINRSTRLWLGGLTDESGELLNKYASDSAIPRIITSDGKEIPLPSVQIDTELAQGYLGLPSVDSWDAALNRFTLAMQRSDLAASAYDYGRRFFDNFFRTSLLVFRVSYIIRNTAEMQIRMFLNGHKSILSDPMTMTGMTIGNLNNAKQARKYRDSYDKTADDIFAETGRKASNAEIEAVIGPQPERVFSSMFAPYKDTVLGTEFEVGYDEALAVANQVEDYFSLIRQAHSLTDPRVYNSAVRQGWQLVGYGTPGFNQGWAHELIMLQRSGIARLVVGGPDTSFAGMVNAAGRMSDEDLKVMALMDSPEYEDLRKLLIGADENFAEILSDAKATKDYLFDSTNSVQNRITQYTGGNPDLLNFIRTGNLRYGTGEILNVARTPNAEDRVKSLATQLERHFTGKQDGFDWAEHFVQSGAKVPWIETIDQRPGISFFNKFFDWANKIERVGAVGPEFRMAYWDRIAELAPGLRSADVDRALKAARTTLGPIKRMKDDGSLDNIGSNHPAFSALQKASDNGDGLLTIDDIHGIASSYAAEVVTGLFYDAARRNKTWNALRLMFPFGQAWGNTIEIWGRLGKKNPIQVYKAQKALDALMEDGSTAVYEFGSDMGAYGQYAPGFAPWEQSTNGGFFYTDSFGETSFMYPFVGRAAALPLNVWAQFSGSGSPGISEIPMQSPATSLNLALGGESIFPGIGPLATLPLATGVLPDNEVTASLRQIAAPFGEKNIIETMVPSWFSKTLGGIGAIPVIGDVVGPWVDVLSPANKNKNLRDSMMILSTSGNYKDWATNDQTARRLRDDASGLGKALLLTTGLFQNVLPSTPYPQMTTQLAGDKFKGALEEDSNTALYTISMLNSLFQQYRTRNGFDDTAAREEFVKDFGPAALFATTGDWKNLSRVPTSQALKFARQNPEIAKANLNMFTLFFPQGDSSDVAATMWIRKYGMGDRDRKTKDDIFSEVVSFLERVQRNRIDSLESNGLINEAEATAARDDLQQRYLETGTTQGVFVDKTEEMDKLNAFVNRYPEIEESNGGQAFREAWLVRNVALTQVREQTGRSNASLGSKAAAPILDWYLQRIGDIEAQYPDFKLLAGKFRREWE
jgi:hypothetical protein